MYDYTYALAEMELLSSIFLLFCYGRIQKFTSVTSDTIATLMPEQKGWYFAIISNALSNINELCCWGSNSH